MTLPKISPLAILVTCIVYNLLDPEVADFYVGVNGDRVNGPVGKEIDLTLHQVEVLENAIIDTMIRDADTNKVIPYRKERFKVMKVGPAFYLDGDQKVPLTPDQVAAIFAGSDTSDAPDTPPGPSAEERITAIRNLVAAGIPADAMNQPIGNKPALPKVGYVSDQLGYKVAATEIATAMEPA
jgi:hypothetical protein